MGVVMFLNCAPTHGTDPILGLVFHMRHGKVTHIARVSRAPAEIANSLWLFTFIRERERKTEVYVPHAHDDRFRNPYSPSD